MKKTVSAIILILLITSMASAHTVKVTVADEERIVFTSARGVDENIYLMDKDGSNIIQLTEIGGKYPVISYDGKLLIYSLGDYRKHKNVLVNYENEYVTAILDSNAYICSISPDNSKMIYTRYADAEKYYLKELYISDIDGSNEMKLVSGGDIWEACFSPVKNKVAYVKDGFIFAVDLDTGDQIQLTFDTPSDGISWSYDGSRIFYCGPEYEIMSVSVDGKNKKKVFKDENILSTKPKNSLDGQKIIFYNESDSQIYKINVDGTGLTKLTDNFVCDSPIWIKTAAGIEYRVKDDIMIPPPIVCP
ncbi:MAG: TolB family protein [Clostridia bacterium]